MADSLSSGEPSNTEEWAGAFNPLSDDRERRVLFAALDSFRLYRRTAHLRVTHRRRQEFYALPAAHRKILTKPPFSLLDQFSKVDDAIDANAEIADEILKCGLEAFGLPSEAESMPSLNWKGFAKERDLSKAHSTVRQLFRDWSADGAGERGHCYPYVLDHLTQLVSSNHPDDKSPRLKVLVPGAGLGRLVYEISRAGFDVEGNEVSYHQLLASNWALNHSGTNQRPLHPFATQFSNVRSRAEQLRKVMVPDVSPAIDLKHSTADNPKRGEMNMSAGDFIVLYGSQPSHATFDAVVTMFFIDTAPNVIRYIDTIMNCLRAGGIWINIGPLLWHGAAENDEDELRGQNGSPEQADANQDAGIGEPGSFELTMEEVLWLLEQRGFQLEKQGQSPVESGYVQDSNSLFQNTYKMVCWVARKVA